MCRQASSANENDGMLNNWWQWWKINSHVDIMVQVAVHSLCRIFEISMPKCLNSPKLLVKGMGDVYGMGVGGRSNVNI